MTARDPYSEMVDEARRATDQPLDTSELNTAWVNIQPELAASPRRLRWWVVAPLGLAAATAALLVLVWPEQHHRARVAGPMTVVMRAGDVQWSRSGRPASLSTDVTELHAGTLELGDHARAALELSRARIDLRGPARLENSETGLKMMDGQASFAVSPGKEVFSVLAGDATLVVLGTRFTADVRDGVLASVAVQEGTVEVQRAGDSQLLGAGDSLGDTHAGTSENFSESWWQQGSSRLAVTTQPPGADVRIDDQTDLAAPCVMVVSPGTHRVEARLPGYRVHRAEVDVAPGGVHHVRARLLEALPPVKQPVRAPTPAKTDRLWQLARGDLKALRCNRLATHVKRLTERATNDLDAASAQMLDAECQLRSGNKRQALQQFRKLASRYPDNLVGETALFERAKLHEQLGHRAEARKALQLYTRRYPTGRFADPVAFRSCQWHLHAEQWSQASTCLDDYRERFANGIRATDTLLLSARLDQRRKNWRGAAKMYQAYFERRPGAPEEDYYAWIVCLSQGGLPGVKGAVATYLRRFPSGAHADELRALQ